ncbi:GGDEF domain-containing protein [Thermomonas sp. HDW16]|uniref:GGDEF domain-containing protein n=1 Tax=Thermomonas sp. HDW16 TaxID=2714945 RepID=UPI00140E2F53|nr:GGDEF domain-containing protein [Thermomonas sp. HDW16]QIL19958.1 GGDEF domain-containing protein [Thermomonas sp. HDW16]
MGDFETHTLSDLRDSWCRLLARPDALMLELGAGGELLVARLRAALSLFLLLLPLINLVGGGKYGETMIGLVGAVMAIVMSQVWLALARQPQRYRWLPWATTTYDISLTTLVLAGFALDSPVTGLNSMVVWVFYLIAIGMTALRNDGRLTLYSGTLALAQYALLSVTVFALVRNPDQLASIDYGTATASNQIQRLVLLALMTAITATIVYRMQKLVDMSGTDGLTGLPNRTWLVHRFPGMLDATRSNGGSLSVCLIDLDYFKRINDELGHLAGDRALKHVVDVLNQQMQDGDWLARLGGEEFTLLLPLPTGRAWERLETMRRTVASQPFLPEHGAELMRLTFSAGVASWPQDGADLSQLLRRADLRLRHAKQEGRNRVLARDP